jgi:hypothetical protein
MAGTSRERPDLERGPGPNLTDLAIAAVQSRRELPMPPWSQSDALCYELVEEMGREGLSCLISIGHSRYAPGGPRDLTFCQLRKACREAAETDRAAGWTPIGACVPGKGAGPMRAAICRAYLKLKAPR